MSDSDTIGRMQLAVFYRMLQQRAGVARPKPLVGQWNAAMRDAVEATLGEALVRSGFIGREIRDLTLAADKSERSNQSRGNIAADALSNALNSVPNRSTILKIRGTGYPDRAFAMARPRFTCCFEIKATSDWRDGNDNRRVITSSPRKLLEAIAMRKLPNPPCHLLGTVLYESRTGVARGLRLDFLEPASVVNVRLEASTSHSMLAQGTHHRRIFG